MRTPSGEPETRPSSFPEQSILQKTLSISSASGSLFRQHRPGKSQKNLLAGGDVRSAADDLQGLRPRDPLRQPGACCYEWGFSVMISPHHHPVRDFSKLFHRFYFDSGKITSPRAPLVKAQVDIFFCSCKQCAFLNTSVNRSLLDLYLTKLP